MAWAAAVVNTLASNKVTGFSSEVIGTSNAAVLPAKTQFGKMSAGRVLLWSLLKLLPKGGSMGGGGGGGGTDKRRVLSATEV